MAMNLDPLASYVKQRGGQRVIRKILISNNGMAAVKAILSMRRWTFTEFGSEQLITFVAMATQDDLNANAEFIRLADSFVEVPSGKNVNNYANVDLICRIAQEQQALTLMGLGEARKMTYSCPSRSFCVIQLHVPCGNCLR